MYRDDRGPIQLGRRLGQGGEGIVYEMGGEAVKIYTAPPSADQADKIRALLTVRSGTLEAVSAWPSRLVYAGRDPVGYVMPKISDHHPISRISLPASRKLNFPEKPWGWLIHVARNLAVAVDQIHAAGVVIGDLSEANIFVAGSAFVRMIDVDSFQISINGRSWNTGVGVPMFLPPELQGRDLRSIQRTTDHDAFGLAVMIFQLLMMGRHPWGGNYQNDKSIEDLIATEPFAYGRTARARGMTPPEISPQMEWLQSDIAAAFERAFSTRNRPTAHDWAVALDTFRSALITCSVSKTHQFVPAQGPCPWCGLEQRNGIFYFLPSSVTDRRPHASTFALADIEKRLLALKPPANFYAIAPKTDRVAPSSRPPWINSYATTFRVALVSFIACAGLAGFSYGAIADALGFGLLLMLFVPFAPARMARRSKRRVEAELAGLIRTWDDLLAQWHAGGAGLILELHASAQNDIRYYRSLSQREMDELAGLKRRHPEIMLDLALAKHLVRDANIKLSKKAIQSLEAYGIQTAADIKQLDLIKVPRIGATRLQKLRDWKAKLVRGFAYDPDAPLPAWMTDEIRSRFDASRRALEARLPQQLERLSGLIARWEHEKNAAESALTDHARLILEHRAAIAMWDDIPPI